jgi:hypothetical protein
MADTLKLIGRLRKLRAARHRLDPPRPVIDVADAVAFVKDRQIVLLMGRDMVASLPEAITGRPIRGSWMADPAAQRIYAILSALPEARVPTTRVLAGKWTGLAPTLAPAVVRVALDDVRRARELARLPLTARQLFARVERASVIRSDELPWPASEVRRARNALERHMLIASRSIHTPSGRHVAELRSWREEPLVRRFEPKARKLAFENALERLLEACLWSAVIAEERAAHDWFADAAEGLSRMIAAGRVRRSGGRRPLVWLADQESALA